MRIYSVHIRRDGLNPDRDIVLVKEGFSWPAALFAPLWALWNELWIVAAWMLLFIAGAAAIVVSLGLGGVATAWLSVGLAVMAGFLANDLMRVALERRGFVLRDVVVAANKDSAAFRFFDRNPELASIVMGTEGAP